MTVTVLEFLGFWCFVFHPHVTSVIRIIFGIRHTGAQYQLCHLVAGYFGLVTKFFISSFVDIRIATVSQTHEVLMRPWE